MSSASQSDWRAAVAVHVRGGHRQREIHERALRAPPAVRGPSKLAMFLIEMFAWGILSAIMVQRIASLALADGLTHPDIQALSQIGGAGLNTW